MARMTETERNKFLQQERSKLKAIRESDEPVPEQFQSEDWQQKTGFPIGTTAPGSDGSEG